MLAAGFLLATTAIITITFINVLSFVVFTSTLVMMVVMMMMRMRGCGG